MKTKILSFLACLICLCFCVSPVGAFSAGLNWEDIIIQTMFSDFLRASYDDDNSSINRSGGINFVFDKFIDKMQDFMIKNPIQQNNDIAFKMPNYQIVTGKVHFVGDWCYYKNDELDSTVPMNQTIEVTVLCLDTDYSGWDYKNAVAVDSSSGKYLFVNALNITITDSTNNVINLVLLCRTNLYSGMSVATDRVSIAQKYYDCYMYSGSTLEQLIYENQYNYGVRFNLSTTNSIDVNIDSVYTKPSGALGKPSGLGEWGSISSSVTPQIRLSIPMICGGRSYLLFQRPTSSTSTSWANTSFYPLLYLYSGFYATNNNTIENTINNRWTNLSDQNYYIDNIFEGDTVINNNNYQDWGGGGLAPIFTLPDVDLPSLPLAELLDLLDGLLPDVKANLRPSLDADIDSLFDRLFDFYSNMPDIGLEWDPTLDNDNYWDIELPSIPDSGGGGSGGDYKPWEPPEYKPVNTAPFIPATYPTIPTGTLPVSFAQNMGGILQDGWDIFDHLDVLVILCPLVIIVLLWRITGK